MKYLDQQYLKLEYWKNMKSQQINIIYEAFRNI